MRNMQHVGIRPGGQEGRAPATHGTGRVCETAGCGTRLSQYNPGPSCRAHTPAPPARITRRVSGRPRCSTDGCSELTITVVLIGGDKKAKCSRCAAAATATRIPLMALIG